MLKATTRKPRVLTIAGSDSSGGAGIQADLKTFAALGCYGTSAVTAITAQNTLRVDAIAYVSAEMICAQIESVLDDIGTDTIKIGMLGGRSGVTAVAKALRAREFGWSIPIVLDPVLLSSSGTALLDSTAVTELMDALFPATTLLTPNLPEAAAFLNCTLSSKKSIEQGAFDLLRLGPKAVLIKGGHAFGASSDDCLAMMKSDQTTAEIIWLPTPRIETRNTHGTGCTLASACAAFIAHGHSIETAVAKAKAYLTAALHAAAGQGLGRGPGPLEHFF